ncbi:UDP-N-acetylglucosamine 1-carboxyvinyltransferase [Pseudoalteromonas sp. AS84]|uniref:UDP-N-acetylglucosamine 1-carboxyvinyltransferase n=1 Tax=Pseudoalteromonas sp. AS84 TaxID=3135778 RepID=UPI00317FDE83
MTNFSSENISKITVKPAILNGTVKVSGAKNSVLRLMAATLLTNEKLVIQNYPATLLDAIVHKDMLEVLGKNCVVQDDVLVVEEPSGLASKLDWHGRSIRNTLLILGGLVTRTGYGAVPLPGGCSIGGGTGERAYDLHVMLLEKLGAKVWGEGGFLHAKAPDGGLVGADIHLPIRSTGATENAIIAGTLANGVTRIWNPHVRPEILDLIDMINSMGGEINVYGQEHIEVIGKQSLRGTTHTVIPDNVEALTWLVGASVTGGEVEIQNFPFEHLEIPLAFLKESGAKMYRHENSMIVKGSSCYPLELSTGPYPGVNSDMQPILAVYAAKALGQSKFVDLRFPGRYGYASELNKMGLKSRTEGNLLIVDGGSSLKGTDVTALDLRAGIALALAALFSEGETHIHEAWQITRGYDRFFEKMEALGVNVRVG